MLKPFLNYGLDLLKYYRDAARCDIDEELFKTGEALNPIRMPLIENAKKELNRQRTIEMAYFSWLAYKLDKIGSDGIKRLLNDRKSPLINSYSFIGIINNPEIASNFVDKVLPRGFIAESHSEIIIAIKGSVDAYD